MKKTSVLIMFISLVMSAYAQKEKIVGSWLMTKAETPEGIQEPYFTTDFTEDGKMIVMGMEVGSWDYDQSSQSIVAKSDFDKDFNGASKIIRISDTEMVLLKDEVTMYYIKVDKNAIASNNQDSKLIGTWRFQQNDWSSSLLKFELPDSFVFVETEEGMTTTYRGSWMYNPQENTVLIIGLHSYISGKNSIEALSNEMLTLKNKENTIQASKEKTTEKQVNRLDFTEADFYTEEGDFKYYDDEDKLPWLNHYDLMAYLRNVSQLVYTYSVLVEDTDAFNSKILTADVEANLENELASIDFIFYGYDRYNLPDDTELPPNKDYSNPLFPLKDDIFRVVGEEEISTPAGTFDCMVIEIMGDFEMRKKAWMVKDKPGVYAKIIEDKPGSFGKYAIYELQEIKNK